MTTLEKKLKNEVNNKKLHVAIIMDGNGRWGTNKKGSRPQGHRHGAKAVKKAVKFASTIGIAYLTLYAFSTENWKRKQYEITVIMTLLRTFAQNEIEAMVKNEICVRFIGRRDRIPRQLLDAMEEMERRTLECTGMVLQVSIDYGGRDELVRAFNQLRLRNVDVTEEDITNALDTKLVPDPDLVIRTGGNKRLSNFLPWQTAYSEIHFTDTLFPDFDETEFSRVLQNYLDEKVERRFGGMPTATAAE